MLVAGKLCRVPSSSMEPTLHCERGTSPGCLRTLGGNCGLPGRATFLKRVVAGPGDTVEERLVRGPRRIFVNGRRVEERYVPARERDSRTYPRTRVPRKSYFLLGDNRVQSCDSRDFGAVPRSRIAAIVVATYWPPSRITIR